MKLFLDGKDWEADYFLPHTDYKNRGIKYMALDSAYSAGFLSFSNKTLPYKATIPGCDRSVMLENGEIDDPYYGRNMDRQRWMEQYCWCFRKTFTLPEELQNKKRYRLVFKGVDYQALFLLNDDAIGRHEGMFIPAEYDVTMNINPQGENKLSIIFSPAPQASPEQYMQFAQEADFAAYHRCSMSYGWDWARGLVPSGIWDSVYLEGSDDVRIVDTAFRTNGNHVHLEIELNSLAELQQQNIAIRLAPKNFAGEAVELEIKADLHRGDNTVCTDFDVEDVRYWYPVGSGEQPLYELTVATDGNEQKWQVGFRDIKMEYNPGSPEGAYPLTFEINGKKVFAKGADWVPLDMIFSRIDGNRYERQIRLAAEAGFNLLRIWGGGIAEKQEFYEACDRNGVMVWQEFLHSCSKYPSNPEYVSYRRREGIAILRKVRNHVSLSMLCGGNEMFYYHERPENPLYLQYEELSRKMAPHLDYHFSSPDFTRPGERNHGPWHFIPHGIINDHKRLLASEVGCNGVPEEESILRFIPENDPWPTGQNWRYHFLYDEPHKVMDEQIKTFQPASLWEFSQTSMFGQADVAGYFMEHYRRNWPYASGCFLWQYNESWPTCAYSLIDYYTLPKMVYYRLAKSNAPTSLSIRDNGWCCTDGKFSGKLFLANENAPFHGIIEWAFQDAAGNVIDQRRVEDDFAAGSMQVDEVELSLPSEVAGNVLIVTMQIIQDGAVTFRTERLYGAPDFSKVFHLEEAELQISKSFTSLENGETRLDVCIRNTGRTAALCLRLKCPGISYEDVYWKDNYVTLLPNETRTVSALITGGQTPDDIVVRGWNYAER